MAEQGERTKVALEYFKELRAETVERLKMRDQILLGYLAAAGALIGYGQQNAKFNLSLVLVVPFLALGAATVITQHQDQIAALNEYISLDLANNLPDRMTPVVNFNASTSGIRHLKRNLWLNFYF